MAESLKVLLRRAMDAMERFAACLPILLVERARPFKAPKGAARLSTRLLHTYREATPQNAL